MEVRHRRAPERLVLRLARRGDAFQVAELRRLRLHDLDLRVDRQSRPGELLCRQARPRRALEIHRARHGEVQRTLQLHRALRLEPHDRRHPDRDAGAEGARGKDEDDGDGEDRSPRGVSALRSGEGPERPDLLRARQRNLPHEPEPAAALGAPRRGLDTGDGRLARHPCPARRLLCARPDAGRVYLGSAMKRVLLMDPIALEGEKLLREQANVVQSPDSAPETIRRLAKDADGIIIRSKLPDDIFEAAPRVKAVAIHGTGTDLVPVASATARGVMVSNLPGVNAQSVAEYVVMGMLMLARNIVAITAAMRTEPWDEARKRGIPAAELEGTTVGVIGVGEIGRRVAKICGQGFGMKVLGNQRRLNALPSGVQAAALEELLKKSDFVVIACPLNQDTHHLINEKTLRL